MKLLARNRVLELETDYTNSYSIGHMQYSLLITQHEGMFSSFRDIILPAGLILSELYSVLC